MLGLLREGQGEAITILLNLDIDLTFLKNRFEALVPENPNAAINAEKKNIHLTRQAENALKRAFLEKKLYKTDVINTGHILMSILRNTDDPTTLLLNRCKIDYEVSKEQFIAILSENEDQNENDFPKNDAFDNEGDEDRQNDSFSNANAASNKSTKKSNTPVLDNFGRDLTEMAELGKLDPIVGREKEIERVSQILSRRKKTKKKSSIGLLS